MVANRVMYDMVRALESSSLKEKGASCYQCEEHIDSQGPDEDTHGALKMCARCGAPVHIDGLSERQEASWMAHYTCLGWLRGRYFDRWFDTWLLFDNYLFHGDNPGPDHVEPWVVYSDPPYITPSAPRTMGFRRILNALRVHCAPHCALSLPFGPCPMDEAICAYMRRLRCQSLLPWFSKRTAPRAMDELG